MRESKEKTKEKVIDAAISLFNVQGYNGTSIRSIAERADVNPALISYYFRNKKGLLEKLMTEFLEGYVTIIEKEASKLSSQSTRTCLLNIFEQLLVYHQERHHLARFVHREITLDTTLVRELMSTYLMKEKHLFFEIIKTGITRKEFKKQPIDFAIIQLRGMLTMPYLHPQYIREVYHLSPNERYFLTHYVKYLTDWVDNYLCLQSFTPAVGQN